ncbi:hypothetical protein [Salinigranum sp. GCM10025319]|uniref:hypothetical protein n=1 Tax=Salinigranum sp. GCM10025319 TaxID=3252687 RepID=UPI0036196B8E
MPPTRRALLAAAGAVFASTAGCLAFGDEPSTPTASTVAPSPSTPETDRPPDTRTSFEGTTVNFPDGPKEQPPIPDPLTEESVREFVHTHEYRFAYNLLWYGSGTDVTLSCEVGSVEDVGVGYRATVTCRVFDGPRDGRELDEHADPHPRRLVRPDLRLPGRRGDGDTTVRGRMREGRRAHCLDRPGGSERAIPS